MLGDAKKLPFEERKRLAIERIQAILGEFDVDIMPILAQNPGSIVAQILYIDIQNEEMLKTLGLAKKRPLSGSLSTPADEKHLN